MNDGEGRRENRGIKVWDGLNLKLLRPPRPSNYLAGDDPEAAERALTGWVDAFEKAARSAPSSRSTFFLRRIAAVRRFVRELDYEPLTNEASQELRQRISAAMADQEEGYRPNADWQDWYVDMLFDERLPFERWNEAQACMIELVFDRKSTG